MTVSDHKDFLFHIGGVEDAVIRRLTEHLHKPTAQGGYVKEIVTYGGELDRDELIEALTELQGRFPLILVAYNEGGDAPAKEDAALPLESRLFEHSYRLTVVVADADARGQRAQRRGTDGTGGAYRMIDDVRRLTLGTRFETEAGVRLNVTPFEPDGIEFIARMVGLTAYAVHFKSSYKYGVTQPPQPVNVTEIGFGVTRRNRGGAGEEAPGVHTRGEVKR